MNNRVHVIHIARVLCCSLVVVACLAQAPPDKGALLITLRNDHGDPISEAKANLLSTAGRTYSGKPDSRGVCRFTDLEIGPYQITVSAEGFADLTATAIVKPGEEVSVEAILTAPARQTDSITVQGGSATLTEQGSSPPYALHREEVRNLPERPATVLDVLPLAPGVIRLPDGQLRLMGSGEHRSALLVNAADATDPATGEFGATVPIDSVQTVNVLASPFLAEYGRFTATVVAVETRRAGEKWAFELNDPLPEFRFRSWHMRGIRSATPRINFGGPIISNRLYLLESFQYEMRATPVVTLPFPNNEKRREALNSFTQLDYIVSATNVLTMTLHAARERTRFANLDYFNPEPVSPDSSASSYSVGFLDRASWGKALVESALTITSVRADVWPQGTAGMTLLPEGNQGNYFNQQTRKASRIEWRETYSRSYEAWGTHNLKFGATLAGTAEHGLVHEYPIDIRDSSGALLESIRFTPGQPINREDGETAAFAQDHWAIGSRLAIELGVRTEQQRLSDTLRVAPRGGFAWTPFRNGRTVLRAGVGIFYDHVPLNVYGFSSYPNQIITLYGPAGTIVSGPAQYQNLIAPTVRSDSDLIYGTPHPGNFAPYSRNWNIQLEHAFSSKLRIKASYSGGSSDGLIVLNPQTVPGGNAFVLNGDGRSKLNQFDITAAVRTGKQGQLYFSYVHSHTTGNINEFGNYLSSYPRAVILPDQYTLVPGDVPQRLLAWGTLRFPWQIGLTPKVEYHSGLPYSSFDVMQNYSGLPFHERFPAYLSVDARISKDFKVSDKYTLRLSVAGLNLTNHFNPVSVHSNTADPLYGTFFGQYKRRFTADFDVIF
jgi:hypothetical protein